MLVISNRPCASHSRHYSLNCTLLDPITITYRYIVMDKPSSNLVAPRVYQPLWLGFSHRDLEKPWEGTWMSILLLHEVCDWHNIFYVRFSFFSEVLKSWIIQKRPVQTPRILFPPQRTRFTRFTSEWTIFTTSPRGPTWRNVLKSGIWIHAVFTTVYGDCGSMEIMYLL